MRIVGFAGSLRRESYNRRLLAAVGKQLEQRREDLVFESIELKDLPLFNADLEAAGDPPAVVRLKAAVGTADGLIIATPEYNHALPAVTKNAVDWLSRGPRPHALEGRPVAVMGASPGRFGTRRAQADLRQVLAVLGAITMVRPWLLISSAEERLGRDSEPADTIAEAIEKYADAFISWVDRFL